MLRTITIFRPARVWDVPMLRVALVLSVLALALPAFALDLPARKPGLWEVRMTVEGREQPPQVVQHCVDAETEKLFNALTENAGGACSKPEVTKAEGKIVIDTICTSGQRKATTHSEITGSFDSAYVTRAISKMENEITPPTTVIRVLEAKWLGACTANQRPGDIILPNGTSVNIANMQKPQALQPSPSPAAR